MKTKEYLKGLKDGRNAVIELINLRIKELEILCNKDYRADEYTSLEDWERLIEEISAIISNLESIKEKIE